MGLFTKNPQESLSVIRHAFKPDEIAYYYPQENFLSGSVLVVEPGQEAVLIKEGDQDGPYINGRYTLDTHSMPNANKFVKKTYEGEVYNCHLYFINKSKPVTVYWGTNHEIKVRDSASGRIIRMFGRGSMALTIDNSLAFIAKMNGQLPSFSTEDIGDFLYEKAIERIITCIAQALQQQHISFTEIDSYTAEISDEIKRLLTNERLFDTYGMHLAEFSIVEININDEDFARIQKEENEMGRAMREAEMEAFKIRSKGFAESDVMKEKGAYYDKERTYDILSAVAEGDGGGIALGAVLGKIAQGTLTPNVGGESTACPACGARLDKQAKFCASCGKSVTNISASCPNCHATLAANARFCSVCGSAVSPAKCFCSSCGSENEGAASFCSNCGARLGV